MFNFFSFFYSFWLFFSVWSWISFFDYYLFFTFFIFYFIVYLFIFCLVPYSFMYLFSVSAIVAINVIPFCECHFETKFNVSILFIFHFFFFQRLNFIFIFKQKSTTSHCTFFNFYFVCPAVFFLPSHWVFHFVVCFEKASLTARLNNNRG